MFTKHLQNSLYTYILHIYVLDNEQLIINHINISVVLNINLLTKSMGHKLKTFRNVQKEGFICLGFFGKCFWGSLKEIVFNLFKHNVTKTIDLYVQDGIEPKDLWTFVEDYYFGSH